MQQAHAPSVSSNFALKEQEVELIPTASRHAASMSIDELEAMRVDTRVVSASKHGLEVITGASCETGAQ